MTGHDDHGHDDSHDHGHSSHDDHETHGDRGSHNGHDDHHDHGSHGDHGHDEHPSGDLVVELFEDAGHDIAARELVSDDHDLIQGTVNDLVDREPVDVVVTTGGTGVTPDDVTPEAVEPLFDKPLPGFGELFRQLSYEEIGTMVVATRAIGGIVEDVPVFTLPGSTNAVQLGVEEIVLPEVGHLAGLARRDGDTDS